VTAAIVGEYVGGYAGLGIFIQTSANARAINLVFAAIALTALLSVLLVGLVNLTERAALRGRPPVSEELP
jgi:ABC-type nitrate/sulfonate/bicarbonate transport system permease component